MVEVQAGSVVEEGWVVSVIAREKLVCEGKRGVDVVVGGVVVGGVGGVCDV